MADKVLHWGWITIQVLFVILMLYQLPPHLVSTYRKTADWWALSSHRRTVRRLTKLEVELHKLDEPIDLAYLQILFYNIVTFATPYPVCWGHVRSILCLCIFLGFRAPYGQCCTYSLHGILRRLLRNVSGSGVVGGISLSKFPTFA